MKINSKKLAYVYTFVYICIVIIHQHLKPTDMTTDQAEKIAARIANEILESMGGDAETICTGDCTTFAKRMIDKLRAEGVEAVIIDNLSDEMKDELSGYPIEQGDDDRVSHCYVSIMDGWMYFDAYDTDGLYNESDLQYTWRSK